MLYEVITDNRPRHEYDAAADDWQQIQQADRQRNQRGPPAEAGDDHSDVV